MTRAKAFEKLNDHFSRALWEPETNRLRALHDAAAPKIAEAARTGDRRFYVASGVPLVTERRSCRSLSVRRGSARAIKGGYGFPLTTDDGRTISQC
jgi:hypothetical protein